MGITLTQYNKTIGVISLSPYVCQSYHPEHAFKNVKKDDRFKSNQVTVPLKLLSRFKAHTAEFKLEPSQ